MMIKLYYSISVYIVILVVAISDLASSEKSYPVSALTIEHPPLLQEPDFPHYSNLLERIQKWNPDTVELSSRVFRETIQHFNFSDPVERAMALRYREAEIPFKMYSVPNIDEVTVKWSDSYLLNVFEGDSAINTLVSKNNHFMYWTGKKADSNKYKNPLEHVKMPFKNWLSIARAADDKLLPSSAPHYYFRKNEPAGPTNRKTTFVGRDISIFSTETNNFFVSDVSKNKGIQCRFGMRGIIAESHFDSGRNMVAMLKGNKRYILNPPESCKHLGIISDDKHPSYRHSIIDWSDLHQAKASGFDKVDAIDTIVHAGEVLYIPSFWFHFIVSLDTSIQCNTRSGRPKLQQGLNAISLCLGNKT